MKNTFNKFFKKLKKSKNPSDNRQIYEKLIKFCKNKNYKNQTDKIVELDILNNIVDLSGKKTIDIITPRVDIIAVEDSIKLNELVSIYVKNGFSRLPVYKDTLDNLIGIIHVKDLIEFVGNESKFTMGSLIRPLLFISPYMKIIDLLYEMIAKRMHMAVVVDEFGGIDGLITFEDILEEMIGDINDEHDKFTKKLMKIINPGYIEADARLEIEDLEKQIGTFLEEEEREEIGTLGGLISFIAGRVPSKNEVILHSSGIEFIIISSDPFKVNKVGISYKKMHKNNEKN